MNPQKKLNKLLSELEKKHKEFKKTAESSTSIWNPPFSLDKYNEETERYWLNPSNQRLMKFGWYSIENLKRGLLELESPVFKEGVDKDFAIWYGAEPTHALITSHYEFFNFYPRNLLHSKNDIQFMEATEFGKLLREEDSLNKKIIQFVEGYIKWEWFDIYRIRHYREQSYGFLNRQGRINVDTETFSFFQVLSHLGFGYFGACNTPEERVNFSWWRDLLMYEACYEFEKENGLLDPEWFKNIPDRY